MDLKELAAERLVQLLHDATRIPPTSWPKKSGLQRAMKAALGVDEGTLSKVRQGETVTINLELVSKIWHKTGILPCYFVDDPEGNKPPPTYRSYLTRGDPFSGPREKSPSSAKNELLDVMEAAWKKYQSEPQRETADTSIATEAKRGAFRSAKQGDGLLVMKKKRKPSRAGGGIAKSQEREPPVGGRSSAAKRKS